MIGNSNINVSKQKTDVKILVKNKHQTKGIIKYVIDLKFYCSLFKFSKPKGHTQTSTYNQPLTYNH